MASVKSNMKTLLVSILLLCGLTSVAQTTNITVRTTVEIAGVGTNSTTIKFQQDGTAKDKLTVDSLVWYHAYAQTSGLYTNDFDNWLKDTAKTAFQQHNAAKSANDLGAAVDKVAAAAKTDTSLLTTQQRNQILAIADSLP